MNDDPILVPYLGQRKYVHGTTMFKLFAGHFSGAITELDFRVNRRVNNNALQLVDVETAKEQHQYPCFISYRENAVARARALVETDRLNPALREAHDEGVLVARADLLPQQSRARVSIQPGFTLVDTAVSLNKALLSRIQPLPSEKQYVFARLELPVWPSSFRDLEIVYWRSVGGLHYISRVVVDGAPCGLLYFSLWQTT